MKKLFLLCLLAGGMSSFTSINENTKIINSDASNTLPSIFCCTATVTYNGQPVTSFTRCGTYACVLAQAAACGYIEANGGTCPQQQ